MPRILIFSDLHGDLKALERLLSIDADYYVAAGDLSNFARGLDPMGVMLQAKAERMYVLPGNHESTTDIELFCAKFGLQTFHHKTFQAGSQLIAGLGYSNITPFRTPGEYTEEQFHDLLQPWAELRPSVLICHCPPKDTPLDQAGPGKHFGSQAIREYLECCQPDYFFCGHIHEAEGVDAVIGATKARNVGKRGYLLEVQ